MYIGLFIKLIEFERIHYNVQEINTSYKMEEDMVLDIVQKLLQNGPTQSRSSERQEILQKLQTYQDNEDVFKEHFEVFMNMEENFCGNE